MLLLFRTFPTWYFYSYNTKLIPLTVLQDVDSVAVQSHVAGISATLLHPPCQLGNCTLCILWPSPKVADGPGQTVRTGGTACKEIVFYFSVLLFNSVKRFLLGGNWNWLSIHQNQDFHLLSLLMIKALLSDLYFLLTELLDSTLCWLNFLAAIYNMFPELKTVVCSNVKPTFFKDRLLSFSH